MFSQLTVNHFLLNKNVSPELSMQLEIDFLTFRQNVAFMCKTDLTDYCSLTFIHFCCCCWGLSWFVLFRLWIVSYMDQLSKPIVVKSFITTMFDQYASYGCLCLSQNFDVMLPDRDSWFLLCIKSKGSTSCFHPDMI